MSRTKFFLIFRAYVDTFPSTTLDSGAPARAGFLPEESHLCIPAGVAEVAVYSAGHDSHQCVSILHRQRRHMSEMFLSEPSVVDKIWER